MVAKLFEQGIENHLRIFPVQHDHRHVTFSVPTPVIGVWYIQADFVANFLETIQ
jgi:hypothetical protein